MPELPEVETSRRGIEPHLEPMEEPYLLRLLQCLEEFQITLSATLADQDQSQVP